VKLHYDRATEEFRRELLAWVEANQPSAEEMQRDPPGSSADLRPWARAWQLRLYEAGWLVPGWPPELGGRNATPVQQLVYSEEFARTRVRRSYNPQGLSIITPSIVDYKRRAEGAQSADLRGEIAWCLGMSEPGAGSDLAGLSTRAELRGDGFLVNGQKVWTSGAHHADFCFCFVRTNTAAPKHKGISVLIIDMKSPGIGVRPLPKSRSEPADFGESSSGTRGAAPEPGQRARRWLGDLRGSRARARYA
jgi:alkylation response protein AidB-like acyl-CoA dehydrogenase